MRSHVELWAGANTHRAVLELADHLGEAVTGATVTVAIYERDGTTEVGGVTWPITMAHSGGGKYEGAIPDTANLVHGKLYTVAITATRGSDKAEWRETGVEARNRGF